VSIPSRPSPPARVKLFLRLATNVNERLRKLLRYRGDLSRLIEESLNSVDLKQVTLVHSIGKSQGNDCDCRGADERTS
jgi:hypothetical protein